MSAALIFFKRVFESEIVILTYINILIFYFQVADFNAHLNNLRRTKFSSYYDANTNRLHVPVKRFKKLKKAQTRKSNYPVALIHGQFAMDFKKYSPEG